MPQHAVDADIAILGNAERLPQVDGCLQRAVLTVNLQIGLLVVYVILRVDEDIALLDKGKAGLKARKTAVVNIVVLIFGHGQLYRLVLAVKLAVVQRVADLVVVLVRPADEEHIAVGIGKRVVDVLALGDVFLVIVRACDLVQFPLLVLVDMVNGLLIGQLLFAAEAAGKRTGRQQKRACTCKGSHKILHCIVSFHRCQIRIPGQTMACSFFAARRSRCRLASGCSQIQSRMQSSTAAPITISL